MTKEEVRYLLKRYVYIADALQNSRTVEFFSISNRKERIEITEAIKKFSNAVLKALEKEKDEFTKEIMESLVLKNNSDVYVFSHYNVTRGTFYTMKENFIDHLFCLCILYGLVTEEEI